MKKDPFDCTDKVRIIEWFEDKYLYFGIKSVRGCSMVLTIQQSKPRSNINKIKLEQHKAQQERLYNTINTYFTPEDSYYREMLEMVKKERDLAMNHKKLLKQFGAVKLFQKDEDQTMQKWRSLQMKRFNNLAAKKQMEEDEFKRKYFLLFKWNMLSQLKEQMVIEQSDSMRFARYSKNFVVKLKLRAILINLHQMFMVKRAATIKKRKMFVMKSKFRMRMLESLAAKGPSMDERLRVDF